MSKKIVILGGGESGVGAALLAQKQGFDVFLTDSGALKSIYKNELIANHIRFEENGHSVDVLKSADTIVKSPGIPTHHPLVTSLRGEGKKVISEIEFASQFTGAIKVCITGANGKTTTTLLTGHILKNAGLKVGVGGNVGKSLARLLTEDSFDYLVVELSSFQLDDMFDFKAEIAILTNITPDHLDRYDYELENYVSSKFRITQNQTPKDAFIFNADDPVTMSAMQSRNIRATRFPITLRDHLPFGDQGAFIQEQLLQIQINQNPLEMKITDLALQGKHNIYNSMAAGVAARILDLRKEVVRESLENFENIEHRMEFVAKVNGITFINDSKATNVNSAWYALESQTKPVIWIAGGTDKGNDYTELNDLVKSRVRAIICLTKDSSKIRKAFSSMVDTIVDSDSAMQAVKIAYDLGKDGDVVLLSPACASFDLFVNYEDRGRQFKDAVRRL